MVISNSISVSVHRRKLSLLVFCFSSFAPYVGGILISFNKLQSNPNLYQASQYLVTTRGKKTSKSISLHYWQFLRCGWGKWFYFALTRGSLCKKALEKFCLCELQWHFFRYHKHLQYRILKTILLYTLSVHMCLIENRKLFYGTYFT